jgi:hypothetical protein
MMAATSGQVNQPVGLFLYTSQIAGHRNECQGDEDGNNEEK